MSVSILVDIATLPDFQEAIKLQVINLTSSLLENYPKVDVSNGISSALRKYEDPGIVDFLRRIRRLELILDKLDAYESEILDALS